MQSTPRRRAHQSGRDTRPHPLASTCESLEVRRLLATITFDTVTRTLTIQSGSGNDQIYVDYDGNGRDISFSGEAGSGNYSNVRKLVIRTGDGEDDVFFTTHSQPSSNFNLEVDTGAGNDQFVGGPGRFDIVNNTTLDMRINLGDGNDYPIFDAGTDTNGCKINSGSTLNVHLFLGTVIGLGTDKDRLGLSYRGEVDGRLRMEITSDRDDDILEASARILAGSSGSIGTSTTPAIMNGGGESDTLDFRVIDESNGGADVFARMDGGFSLFDHDVGTHTANVVATGLEAESIVTAFRDRSITQHTRAGDPVVLSGVVFEPNPGQSFFLDVDWGDGVTETFEFAPGTFTSGVTRLELSHVYERQGKYDVKLQWRDALAFGNSDVLSVHVLPRKGPKK